MIRSIREDAVAHPSRANGQAPERHRVAAPVLTVKNRDEGAMGEARKADGKETGDRVKRTPVTVKKIGRNDPCPCGSGKKYKKCCGANS